MSDSTVADSIYVSIWFLTLKVTDCRNSAQLPGRAVLRLVAVCEEFSKEPPCPN